MSRRGVIVITLALMLLLFLVWGGILGLLGFWAWRLEQSLGSRLEGIGQSLAVSLDQDSLGALAATFEAIQFDATIPHIGNDAPTADALWTADEAASFSEALSLALDEVREATGLASLMIVSQSGVTLASTPNGEPVGIRSAVYSIDRAELDESVRTGRPVHKPLYQLGDSLQKRVYVLLYPRPAHDLSDGSAEAAAEVTPLDPTLPAVFLRLEASVTYLRELARLRQLGRLALTIGSAVVLLVGLGFYLTLQRLQKSNERLEREDRFRSLGRLAAGLAHEMRNPLGILRFGLGELHHMHRSAVSSPDAEFAGQVEELQGEIDRMNRLIANILSFSHGEAFDGRGSCDLRTTVESCVRWIEKSAPSHWNVEVTGLPSTPVELAISGDALRQVLLNLLRNAAEALEGQEQPPPLIVLRCEAVAGRSPCAVIAVRDNGPGIPRKVAKRIFDPFMTTREQGTGLGLPISKRLLESVGGALVHRHAPARGAEFELRIPIMGGEPDARQASSSV